MTKANGSNPSSDNEPNPVLGKLGSTRNKRFDARPLLCLFRIYHPRKQSRLCRFRHMLARQVTVQWVPTFSNIFLILPQPCLNWSSVEHRIIGSGCSLASTLVQLEKYFSSNWLEILFLRWLAYVLLHLMMSAMSLVVTCNLQTIIDRQCPN